MDYLFSGNTLAKRILNGLDVMGQGMTIKSIKPIITPKRTGQPSLDERKQELPKALQAALNKPWEEKQAESDAAARANHEALRQDILRTRSAVRFRDTKPRETGRPLGCTSGKEPKTFASASPRLVFERPKRRGK